MLGKGAFSAALDVPRRRRLGRRQGGDRGGRRFGRGDRGRRGQGQACRQAPRRAEGARRRQGRQEGGGEGLSRHAVRLRQSRALTLYGAAGGVEALRRRHSFSGSNFSRHHGIRRRTTGRQRQPRAVRQGDRPQEAALVHARRADRLPAAQLRAAAGHRSGRAELAVRDDARRRARFLQHLLGRLARADEPDRARRDALHHRLDRHPARDLAVADAGRDQEGRRERAQEAQPIYPLRHRLPDRDPGLFHRRRPRELGRRRRA